jgi:hypothetical protein
MPIFGWGSIIGVFTVPCLTGFLFHTLFPTAMPVPASLLRLLLNGLDGTVNDAKERLSYW